ncbi:MAG: putative rane protein precursor [Firmicutes bacterium]|nr:putative rane protein precursor [Bacillota bacterium]
MTPNEIFLKKCIRIGSVTLVLGIIANFMPAMYLWLGLGVKPPIDDIGKIFLIIASTYLTSWITQPITFFPLLGTSGSYVTWLSGSGAEIKTPASNMAQKAVGVEQGTPQGNVISTIGVATSVFVTFVVITSFVFAGQYLIPLLPVFVTKSFGFLLPAVFAAVVINMAKGNLDLCAAIVVFATLTMYVQKHIFGFPTWFATLFIVLMGAFFGYVKYRLTMNKDKEQLENVVIESNVK